MSLSLTKKKLKDNEPIPTGWEGVICHKIAKLSKKILFHTTRLIVIIVCLFLCYKSYCMLVKCIDSSGDIVADVVTDIAERCQES